MANLINTYWDEDPHKIDCRKQGKSKDSKFIGQVSCDPELPEFSNSTPSETDSKDERDQGDDCFGSGEGCGIHSFALRTDPSTLFCCHDKHHRTENKSNNTEDHSQWNAIED